MKLENQKIFTYRFLKQGTTFEFYGDVDSPLSIEDVVLLWMDRENNGLGAERVYATAKVTRVPNRADRLHEAVVL